MIAKNKHSHSHYDEELGLAARQVGTKVVFRTDEIIRIDCAGSISDVREFLLGLPSRDDALRHRHIEDQVALAERNLAHRLSRRRMCQDPHRRRRMRRGGNDN